MAGGNTYGGADDWDDYDNSNTASGTKGSARSAARDLQRQMGRGDQLTGDGPKRTIPQPLPRPGQRDI